MPRTRRLRTFTLSEEAFHRLGEIAKYWQTSGKYTGRPGNSGAVEHMIDRMYEFLQGQGVVFGKKNPFQRRKR